MKNHIRFVLGFSSFLVGGLVGFVGNAYSEPGVALGSLGSQVGIGSTDINGIAIGTQSGQMNGAASGNIAIGLQAGRDVVGDYNTSIGWQSRAGLATRAGDNSNIAIGFQTAANGGNSVAIGNQAQASSPKSPTGQAAIAIGDHAQASFSNSVALGAGSRANAENSVALGAGSEANSPNSVDVGGRRLTSVSDGSDPSDASTVGQLSDTASKTLRSANSYTDKSIANVASNAANTAQNNAINDSHQYTDNSSANAVKTANGYTDKGVSDAKGFASNAANTAQNNAINDSHQYTDDVSVKTLNSANGHANQVAGIAQANAEAYTNRTAVQYDGGINGDRSSLTLQGQNGTQIHNLADGTAPNDAATVGQLNRNNAFNQQQFMDLRGQLRAVKLDSNAGTASAMAVASLPQASVGHSMFNVGVSTYMGQEGTAFGYSTTRALNPNMNVTLKVAGTVNTRGHGGFAAGGGIEW